MAAKDIIRKNDSAISRCSSGLYKAEERVKDSVVGAVFDLLKEVEEVYILDAEDNLDISYKDGAGEAHLGKASRLYLDNEDVVVVEFTDGESVYLDYLYVSDILFLWDLLTESLEDEDYDEVVQEIKDCENGYPKSVAPMIAQIEQVEEAMNKLTSKYRDKVIGLFHDVLKRDKELLMPNPEQRCKVCYSGADADGESGRVKRIYLNEENKVAVELTDGGHILFSDIYESDYRYIYELMFGFLK